MVFLKRIIKSIIFGAASALVVFACSTQNTKYTTDIKEADKVEVAKIDTSAFDELKEEASSVGENSSLEDRPFYDPVGGETLARVAFALYGQRDIGLLKSENPNLDQSKKLESGDKIYFNFDKINPEPRMLTKGMIDRYTLQLAEVILRGALEIQNTQIENGETLQDVSSRLYGTTRYWTEIYLLNHEVLKQYDRINPNTDIKYIPRKKIGALESKSVPIAGMENAPEPSDHIENKEIEKKVSFEPENIKKMAGENNEKPEQPINIAKNDKPAKLIEEPVDNLKKAEAVPVSSDPIIEVVKEEVVPEDPKPITSDSKKTEQSNISAAAESVKPISNPTTTTLKKKPVEKSVPEESILNETNIRRSVYGVVAILILSGAIYFIRTNRKSRVEPRVSDSVGVAASAKPRVGVPIPPASLRANERDKHLQG